MSTVVATNADEAFEQVLAHLESWKGFYENKAIRVRETYWDSQRHVFFLESLIESVEKMKAGEWEE